MNRIAFIGLGNMGAPMAQNLQRAGYQVVGFDLSPVSLDDVKLASSIQDAVKEAKAVITMLPDGRALGKVYAEALPCAATGTLFIDCSTVDIDSALKAAKQANDHQHVALDAPVSGGTKGAQAGSLTFMVGGRAVDLAKAGPLLEAMGGRTVHCGDNGSGQAAKICNNLLLGITMAGTCEAIALADKLGLDRQAFFDVASTSSGQCWSLNQYSPMPGVGPDSPSDHDYAPGFATSLMLKDLELGQMAARTRALPSDMGRQAAQLFRSFAEAGGQDRDFSALVLHLSKKRTSA